MAAPRTWKASSPWTSSAAKSWVPPRLHVDDQLRHRGLDGDQGRADHVEVQLRQMNHRHGDNGERLPEASGERPPGTGLLPACSALPLGCEVHDGRGGPLRSVAYHRAQGCPV